jgi:methionyl-tRNA formyltransferase
MRVLFLGPGDSPVYRYLHHCADTDLSQISELVCLSALVQDPPDMLILHGYRHILSSDIVRAFSPRIINLHISLLPWNRGSDPNLWSFLEDTPSGVSIHVVDEGIDTGPVLAQRAVSMKTDDTLRTSYQRLQDALLSLFMEEWPAMRAGQVSAFPQQGSGTTHRHRDIEPYLPLLQERGWDTPVRSLRGKGLSTPGL